MTDFIHKHGILIRLATVWLLALATYVVLTLLEPNYWGTMDQTKATFWAGILATLFGITALLERWNARRPPS